MKKILLILLYIFTCLVIYGQGVLLNAYVFNAIDGERLSEVQVNIYHNDFLLSNLIETDRNGAFEIQLPGKGQYRLEVIRPGFERKNIKIYTQDKQTYQVAIPMLRLEGYDFVGTVKRLLTQRGELAQDLTDVRVEIYSQTTATEELNIIATPTANFDFSFERGNRYTLMLRKKGYFAKRFDILVDVDGCILCFQGLGSDYPPNVLQSITDNKTIFSTDISLRPIEINEAIQLENIYYDYDKWNIRPDARPSLDRLVNIMRATPIIIELGSHTDSRGKDEYNLGLSQKRAQAAVDYIVSKGISKERISAVGYGESQLKNNCEDGTTCSEKEHQLNRRTEFKVTKMMTGSSFDNKTLKEIMELERAQKRRAMEELKIE